MHNTKAKQSKLYSNIDIPKLIHIPKNELMLDFSNENLFNQLNLIIITKC